jgi:two-component system sensor histidine kinase ArlS
MMRSNKWSLTSKLSLFIGISKLLIVLLFVWLLPYISERVSSKYTNTLLVKKQEKVLQEIAKNGIDFYLEGEEAYGSYTLLKEEYIALLPAEDSSFSVDLFRDTVVTEFRMVEVDTILYRIRQHAFRANGKNWLLETGRSLESVYQFSAPLQRFSLIFLSLLMILTLAADLWYSRFLLRPLRRIVQSKVKNAQFPFLRLPEPVQSSTAEFYELDQSLISLMRNVKEGIEKERAFTANASHELLTPVSILQQKLENLLLEETLQESHQDRISEALQSLYRLRKIAQSLLLLARIENDQFPRKDTVDLEQLVLLILRDLQPIAEDKQIDVVTQLPSPLWIQLVHHTLFQQLLFNLIHNAIRYNKTGGKLYVSWGHSQLGFSDVQPQELWIEDTGVGIDPYDLPFLFQRFRKGTNNSFAVSQSGNFLETETTLPSHESNSISQEFTSKEPPNHVSDGNQKIGYGLGLAIVKAIADHHHLTIQVKSEPKKGTAFVLSGFSVSPSD